MKFATCLGCALLCFPWLGLLPNAFAADAPADSAATPDVKAVVQRSLDYLAKGGQEWIEKRKCVSCHRVSFLTWSYRAAAQQGIELPNDNLGEWLRWSLEDLAKAPDPKKPIACQINHDGIAQMLIGHTGEGTAALTAEQRDQLVDGLLAGQQSDGSWKPAGQLPSQKRPLEETTQVSTAWNIIALGIVPANEKVTAARERGLAALGKPESGKSTEFYAAQLILAVQQRDEPRAKLFNEELRKLQHDDGGWGWLTADPSDALATGQALYALQATGVKAEEDVIRSGVKFLCSTQQADGSWAVKGTKQNKQKKVEETATYWGSGWATIALLRSLPK